MGLRNASSYARARWWRWLLLGWLLGATAVWGQPGGRPAGDAPLRPRLAWAAQQQAPEALAPGSERQALRPPGAEAYGVHGAFALVPVGGLYLTSHQGEERLWRAGVEALAGTGAGWLPAQLLFLHPAEAEGRWAELDVAAFGTGLVVTPPLAALGTWAVGELAFQGSRDRGSAYLGALGGAAVGTLLGVAVHGLLEELMGDSAQWQPVRELILLEMVGVGSAMGYQVAGGGPRTREP